MWDGMDLRITVIIITRLRRMKHSDAIIGGDGWYGIGMVPGAKNQAGEFLIVLF